MKNSIDWAEVGSGGRFEDIVGVLLSTLHPESERIDGAGGDGGRDHQLRSVDRLDLWQSKYFVKRLSESKTRKGQIKESLQTAAGLQPDSWTLITPMVPNATELKWFDGLRSKYPFPLCWRDGTWLDARLAEHQGIVRFFMGANDEYVALIRELKEEQEALVDGLPAATSRIERLAAKIDAANPFYRVDFVVENERIVSSSLRPKYLGAEKDSPITISFTVETGSSPAGTALLDDLRAALDWGDEVVLPPTFVRDVVVDAPHGMGGPIGQAQITISPASTETIDVSMRLAIQAPDGRQLAALPAKLVERIRASRGVTLHGRDITGTVSTRLRLDLEKQRVSLGLTYEAMPAMLPGAALPVLRFRASAVCPNTISFSVGGTTSSAPVPLPPDPALPEAYIQLVEGLERLQQAACEPFPVPEEWSIEDQRQVRRGVRLLDGERVAIGGGTVRFIMEDPRPLLRAFTDSPTSAMAFASGDPYVIHVAGHELSLGSCTFYVQRATLDPTSMEPDTSGVHHIAIVPDPGHGIEVALGALAQSPGQPPAEPS